MEPPHRTMPLTRSETMARIRSRDTQPELAVRRAMHAAGLRYRLHSKHLPGRPDLAFPARRTALFVHGCFWHRHRGCPHATTPATRRDYWLPKLARNVERDRCNEERLRAMDWTVIVAWECELRRPAFLAHLVERIRAIPPGKRLRRSPHRMAQRAGMRNQKRADLIHDTSGTDAAEAWPAGPGLF